MVQKAKKQNQSHKFYKLVAEVKKHAQGHKTAMVDVDGEVGTKIDSQKIMTTKTFRKAPLQNLADMRKAIRHVQRANEDRERTRMTKLDTSVVQNFYSQKKNKFTDNKVNRIKDASNF